MKKRTYISLISLVGILALSFFYVFNYSVGSTRTNEVLKGVPKQLMETKAKAVDINETVTWAANALFSFLPTPTGK